MVAELFEASAIVRTTREVGVEGPPPPGGRARCPGDERDLGHIATRGLRQGAARRLRRGGRGPGEALKRQRGRVWGLAEGGQPALSSSGRSR